MTDGGILTLETRDWENIVVSNSVTDIKAGIAPEVPRIFDPFFIARKQHGDGVTFGYKLTPLFLASRLILES